MHLPETTTDRLLAVADIIEAHPEQWNQDVWCDSGRGGEVPIPKAAGAVDELLACGTTACVAGWAVTLYSGELAYAAREGEIWSYHETGRMALGLQHDLAAALFCYDVAASPEDMADLLRHIAKVPEGERTFGAVDAILPDRLRDIIYEDEDEDDE